MQPHEATVLIEQIVDSLRNNPGQFNIQVNIETTGAIGIGGQGGPGIVGISQRGGAGFQASVSVPTTAQIHIMQQNGLKAVFGRSFVNA